MTADNEDLHEPEGSQIYVKRIKSQEAFIKGECEFWCANGTLRLPSRPRPSLPAEGNLEPEDDVEIEEGNKREGKTEDSWSVSGEFLFRHHSFDVLRPG